MKIALFHNLPSGGAKRVIYEHARSLKALGHRLDLYVLGSVDETFLPLEPFVTKTIRVQGTDSVAAGRPLQRVLGFRRILRSHEEVARAMNAEGYDVAYLHTCLATGAPYAARLLRMPTVYYCQEPLFHVSPIRAGIRDLGGKGLDFKRELWNYFKQRYERITAQSITRVIVNSYHSHEFVMQVWGINAPVCYLGVDSTQFSPDDTAREEFVLSVGALVPHKGFPFIVRALGRLPAPRPELVLVSNYELPGQRALVEEEAKRSGVRLRIMLDVPESELVNWYRRAKLFAYASYLEPFGLAPLEAMACGTPVVAVREGGVRESVPDGEAGLLVDRDEDLFANAVDRLLRNDAERERFGRSGPPYVARAWSWEASIRNLLWQFEQAVKTYREQ
jgi:glycosyltransferase involved in cell wall biosynthesis